MTTETVAADADRLARLIGIPFAYWANNCHEISLALLRTGEFGSGRVARGFCHYVTGQHSWAILGDNCYSRDAVVVDPTLWAHNPYVKGIWIGPNFRLHHPHGEGSCFSVDPPSYYGGEIIELTPRAPLSVSAKAWIGVLGPLDFRGWMEVAHLPVENWPAAEIIAAIKDTPPLSALVPIDTLGMLTDRNPGNRYR